MVVSAEQLTTNSEWTHHRLRNRDKKNVLVVVKSNHVLNTLSLAVGAMASTGPAASKVVIGTHNGKFHCDEALACYMLQLLPEYKQTSILRTRDQEQLKDCTVVVDVGGVYDPSIHRYDHHQRYMNLLAGIPLLMHYHT